MTFPLCLIEHDDMSRLLSLIWGVIIESDNEKTEFFKGFRFSFLLYSLSHISICKMLCMYIVYFASVKRGRRILYFFYALQKIGLALLCLKESYIQQPKDSFIQGPTQSIVCIQNVYEFTYGGVVGNIYISCMN